MTTLQPRPPYTKGELAQLYPASLQLEQVQILLRHGERTPVSARFQNAGLDATWNFCSAANRMRDVVLAADGSWDTLTWKRQIETLGSADVPRLAAGFEGADAVCKPGELTDPGRRTTLALGQRIRSLYVGQLGFLSTFLDDSNKDSVRLRATPIPRALESVQQTFTGLYPSASRSPGLPPPAIVQRSVQDETLFPNESGCKRFAELSHAFADRAAKLWNDSPEMAYINKKIGKWMPEESPVVKVDSHPRLSGIMDTVNATNAHLPHSPRLNPSTGYWEPSTDQESVQVISSAFAKNFPSEFFDPTLRANIDRICVEEWFAGYQESAEYRRLGIGGLIGDLTRNMLKPQPFKLALSGCHDTTLFATLAALGGFTYDKSKWPPYTSSIAFELFSTKNKSTGFLGLFSSGSRLDNHYVRIRYNDTPITLPFCQASGNHLEGDESFCTLKAFKEAADLVTPKDWKKECRSNLGKPAFPEVIEPPPGVKLPAEVGS